MPPTAAAGVGWMAQVANTKRQLVFQEIKHVGLTMAKGLRQLNKLHCKGSELYLPDHALEYFFETYKSNAMAGFGWTEEQYIVSQKICINSVYGDPYLMQQNGQLVHSMPYWNPTSKRINIHPMGLIKTLDAQTREVVFYEFVDPGEHIMIPTAYTKGGKHSTVACTAPQLRPLPRQVDETLDLAPFTYTEWCTYRDAVASECCKKSVAWHTDGYRLLCTRCGKTCKGISF